MSFANHSLAAMAQTIFVALATLISVPASASSPDAGVKLYRDWVVGCDNMRNCHAVSLDSEGDAESEPWGDGGLEISIKRSGGPNDSPQIRFLIKDAAGDIAPKIRGLAVDDDREAILRLRSADIDSVVEGKQAARLLDAMADRRMLGLVDERGEHLASASLMGLKAALRFMDAQQYRTGTVSALVARGAKASNSFSIPPMVPLPAIRVAPASSKPPVMLDEASLAAVRKLDPCLEYAAADAIAAPPKYYRLDAATSLLILPTSCGGYNPSSQIMVIDEQGKPKIAPFAPFEGSMVEDDAILSDATWDDGARVLGTFGRGRGLADCGQAQEFAWDGRRFVTVLTTSMPECRGSWDYITTYRRDVVIGN